MKKPVRSMPNAVKQRIMRRAANGERALVVVIKNGRPSRVFGFEEYLQRKALTRKVKPWESRKRQKAPDPLGAIDSTVIAPITRETMYE